MVVRRRPSELCSGRKVRKGIPLKVNCSHCSTIECRLRDREQVEWGVRRRWPRCVFVLRPPLGWRCRSVWSHDEWCLERVVVSWGWRCFELRCPSPISVDVMDKRKGSWRDWTQMTGVWTTCAEKYLFGNFAVFNKHRWWWTGFLSKADPA